MRIHIQHLTRHRYSSPVGFGDHRLALRPREDGARRVLEETLTLQPDGRVRNVVDAEGNQIRICNFGSLTSDLLEFDLRMVVETADVNPFDFVLDSHATTFPFDYTDGDRRVLAPYLETGPHRDRVLDWYRSTAPGAPEDLVSFLTHLNTATYNGIPYERREEEGIQTPAETLDRERGSCRDLAVLLMEELRGLGLAARFVSGYLYDPPDAEGHTFNRAAGAMHAWVEVYLPGAGWKGMDPTNGILANGNFLPCAVSGDPHRIEPVKGDYFSNTPVPSALEVTLTLEPC